MYSRFGLTLMATQACNLACDYCYIRNKKDRSMPLELARKAIDRAVASIAPGCTLELGLFGGEPFLVPDLLEAMINYAESVTVVAGLSMSVYITTNGTVLDDKARSIMLRPNVEIVFSMDGSEPVHNRHRQFPDGGGSYGLVADNFQRLRASGKSIKVIAVVSPDTVDQLTDNITSLQTIGCDDIELSLDLWSTWDEAAMAGLKRAVADCGRLWLGGLPDKHISWFDDMTVRLSTGVDQIRRCGFGKGDIAITPKGNLYPCERLIDGDQQDNPMRLEGSVFEGDDFLFGESRDIRTEDACKQCGIFSQCKTACGCCNYVRSGSPGRPDKLLCLFNQWVLTETELILNQIIK